MLSSVSDWWIGAGTINTVVVVVVVAGSGHVVVVGEKGR